MNLRKIVGIVFASLNYSAIGFAIDFSIRAEECTPSEYVITQIQSLAHHSEKAIFSSPYFLMTLSDGTEFGHYVEALCVFDPHKSVITYLVCDSSGYTKPLNYRFSSTNIIEFDIASQHSNKIIGKGLFHIESKQIETKEAQHAPPEGRGEAPRP